MYVNGKYCRRVQESDYTTMQHVTMRYIVFATGACRSAILSQSVRFSSSPKVIVRVHEI